MGIYIYIYIMLAGLQHFLFFPYIGKLLPTDFHIFQRGWYTQPPTSDKSLRAEATIRDWAHPATRLGWMSKQHPKYFDDEKPGVTTLVTLVEPGSQWLSAVPVAFCGCAAWGFNKIQSQYKTFQNGSKWGMGLFEFEVKSCHLSLDPSLSPAQSTLDSSCLWDGR